MPKISPPEFVEGVVEKGDITELQDSINTDLVGQIDGSNIREEGLDRRVFKEGSIVPKFTTTQRIYSSEIQSVVCDTGWRRISYSEADHLKGNKGHSNIAMMPVQWDPETDTHCVIRLSMYIDTQTTDGRPVSGNNLWDFGLLVIPPGKSFPGGYPQAGFGRGGSLTDIHRVAPFQRVGLNTAFTQNRTQGHFTKGQSEFIHDQLGLGGTYETGSSSNERSRIGTATSSTNTFGFHNDTYPRGTWYQYAFDRGANFNASFSMTCHATSELSSAADVTSSFLWPDAGKAEIYVMYRSFLGGAVPPFVDVHNLNLSAQIYRR